MKNHEEPWRTMKNHDPPGRGYLRVAGIDPIQISPGVAFTLSATDFFGALLFLRRILGRCSLSVATRTRRWLAALMQQFVSDGDHQPIRLFGPHDMEGFHLWALCRDLFAQWHSGGDVFATLRFRWLFRWLLSIWLGGLFEQPSFSYWLCTAFLVAPGGLELYQFATLQLVGCHSTTETGFAFLFASLYRVPDHFSAGAVLACSRAVWAGQWWFCCSGTSYLPYQFCAVSSFFSSPLCTARTCFFSSRLSMAFRWRILFRYFASFVIPSLVVGLAAPDTAGVVPPSYRLKITPSWSTWTACGHLRCALWNGNQEEFDAVFRVFVIWSWNPGSCQVTWLVAEPSVLGS